MPVLRGQFGLNGPFLGLVRYELAFIGDAYTFGWLQAGLLEKRNSLKCDLG